MKKIFKLAVFVMIFTLIFLSISFSVLASALYFFKLSPTIINQFSPFVGGLIIFVSTYFFARITNKGILLGLILGFVFSVAIFLITFFLSGKNFSVMDFIKIGFVFFVAVLGGVLGSK